MDIVVFVRKFQFVEQFRPPLSLRAPQGRGNLKEHQCLEMNERSPHPHTRVRDDMRYKMAIQLFNKLEFVGLLQM